MLTRDVPGADPYIVQLVVDLVGPVDPSRLPKRDRHPACAPHAAPREHVRASQWTAAAGHSHALPYSLAGA